MSLSDSSALSSPPSTDDEAPDFATEALSSTKAGGSQIGVSPPARKKRPVSPPHEEAFADNPDIAVSLRFSESLRQAGRVSSFLVPLLASEASIC